MHVFTHFNLVITDGPTDQQTVNACYRVVCPQTKKNRKKEKESKKRITTTRRLPVVPSSLSDEVSWQRYTASSFGSEQALSPKPSPLPLIPASPVTPSSPVVIFSPILFSIFLFFRAFFSCSFFFFETSGFCRAIVDSWNLVVHKSTCSLDGKRITRRNLGSLLIALGLENHDINSHSQNHVIFSRMLFLDGSFQQAETYTVYRACKYLTIFNLIFTSLLLQWNSVILHLWMILCWTCMVINTNMTPVMKKMFSTKSVAFKSYFFVKSQKTTFDPGFALDTTWTCPHIILNIYW